MQLMVLPDGVSMAAPWGTGLVSGGAERWSLLTGRPADPSGRVGIEMVRVSADATIADTCLTPTSSPCVVLVPDTTAPEKEE